MNHDCIANSVIQNTEVLGTNTVKRLRVCKICSRVYSTVETYRGMNVTSSKEIQAKIDTIVEDVCHVFGVNKLDLMGKKRPRKLALVRHAAMYLCRDAGYSYPQIGRTFGRHHATIIYACKHIEQEMKTNMELRKFVLLARFRSQSSDL